MAPEVSYLLNGCTLEPFTASVLCVSGLTYNGAKRFGGRGG